MININHKNGRSIIFHSTKNTIIEAVLEAIQTGGANLESANLSNVDLKNVNLRGVNLKNANLINADLRGSNLTESNLQDADLNNADLRGAILNNAVLRNAKLNFADLRGTALHKVDLSEAQLNYTDLRGANLVYADLTNADLRDAVLQNSNLTGAKLNIKGTESEIKLILAKTQIVPQSGSFIGWKKLANNTICKLQITEDAQRVGGLFGRKCRANKVVVLEGEGASNWHFAFKYRVGETLEISDFNSSIQLECGAGIHFFLSKEEAEDYRF